MVGLCGDAIWQWCVRTLYSLMKAYRMNLISAGPISVYSTFKYLSEIHNNNMLENDLLLLADLTLLSL